MEFEKESERNKIQKSFVKRTRVLRQVYIVGKTLIGTLETSIFMRRYCWVRFLRLSASRNNFIIAYAAVRRELCTRGRTDGAVPAARA